MELACDETVDGGAFRRGAVRLRARRFCRRLGAASASSRFRRSANPSPRRASKRVLKLEKAREESSARLVLVLAVRCLALDWLVNPYPKDAIFGQRYVVNKLLHAAPQFDYGFPKTVRSGDYPAFALSSDHHIYRSDRGTDFLACGYELEEVSVSYDQLLRLLLKDSGVAYSDATEALSRVRTCWVTQRMEDGYPFYLVMQAGEQVYLIVVLREMGHGRSWRPVVLFAPARRAEIQLSGAYLQRLLKIPVRTPRKTISRSTASVSGEENPDASGRSPLTGVRNGHEIGRRCRLPEITATSSAIRCSPSAKMRPAHRFCTRRGIGRNLETPFTAHRPYIVTKSLRGTRQLERRGRFPERCGASQSVAGRSSNGRRCFPENPRTAAPMSASTTPDGNEVPCD